jgi:hypothetical protein
MLGDPVALDRDRDHAVLVIEGFEIIDSALDAADKSAKG